MREPMTDKPWPVDPRCPVASLAMPDIDMAAVEAAFFRLEVLTVGSSMAEEAISFLRTITAVITPLQEERDKLLKALEAVTRNGAGCDKICSWDRHWQIEHARAVLSAIKATGSDKT